MPGGAVPAMYVSFDSIVGTTAVAQGFAALNATLMGGATVSTGLCGNGASLTPSSSAFIALGASGIPLPQNGWTLSAWYNNLHTDPTSFHTLFRGFTGDHQALIPAGSTILGAWFNTADISTSLALHFFSSLFNMSAVASGWHQLTAVGADGATTYYVDGVVVGTAAVMSTTDVYAVGNYFQGGQVLYL